MPASVSILTGPLADALQRGRESFNTRFALARKSGAIDAAAFFEHLVETVDPIVRAVALTFPEKVDATVTALYDLSLELFTAGLLGPGAKSPLVALAWRELLPKVPALVAREPARLAASVSNAVYNLAAGAHGNDGAARAQAWLTGMMDVATRCTGPQAFLDVGKVLAWRCGLAQYRPSALEVARRLEPSLAAGALGLPASTAVAAINAALDRMAGNPWLTPTEAISVAGDPKRLRLVRRAGAFRGFGGPFLRPPVVAFADGQWLVSDGETTFGLIADAFGEYFHRLDQPAPAIARTLAAVRLAGDGAVQWGQAAARCEDLTACTSIAADEVTLAVTVATSHHVFLLARG